MPFGWAALAGGVISAVGSYAGSSKQADAQNQATQTQKGMFDTINKQEQPFIQGGYGANTELQKLMGLQTGNDASGLGNGYLSHQFNATDFKNNLDPGYEWQKEQGQQAIRNSDTPGTGALSGAALKDLMGFNQGMASTGYQNAFNRYTQQQNNIFGRLSGIAGMGQNAAGNVGSSGTSLGTGIGQAQAAAGASRAGGWLGAGNNIGQSIQMAGYLNGNNASSSATDAFNGGG